MHNLKRKIKKSLPAGRQGFTLVELLVVIAIIGILVAAVVLAINPADIMKKGRDSTRLSDMESLRKAVDLAIANGGEIADGTGTTAPALGSPSQASDGTGWLAFDVSNYLAALPLAPRNTLSMTDAVGATVTDQYQYDAVGGQYELRCYLEHSDNASKYTTDGGNNAGMFEAGTNVGL
ncbi:MAG: prepilin-type N-terminal cleavage/methylation domain-containing protein [bacterium]